MMFNLPRVAGSQDKAGQEVEAIDVSLDPVLAGCDRLVVDVPALGGEVVVLRSKRRVFVFANRCPHLGRQLSDACVVRGKIECPGHGWRFRSDTGACANAGSRRRLGVFEAEIVDGRVRVHVPTGSEGMSMREASREEDGIR